jgi:hypothetical protein
VALDLRAIADRLCSGVMAPLVLGGALRPGRAIGTRAALALGEAGDSPWTAPSSELSPELPARVDAARLARVRRLLPVDRLDPPTAAEWTLCAALNNLLCAANPAFDAPLRRGSGTRILELASATIERVPAPSNVRDALSRHSWFARLLDVARTDTDISWWVGSRKFLGVDPPARLRSWPELRRVRVVATPRPLLDLAPLAFDRGSFAEAIASMLARSPLTDVATCTRSEPSFAWGQMTLTLIAARAGRTLALRALARLPVGEVDSVLGRATRDLFVRKQASISGPALALLAERALAEAQGHLPRLHALPAQSRPDAAFARALGAVVAKQQLDSQPGWAERDRRSLLAALEPALRSEAAREAVAAVRA